MKHPPKHIAVWDRIHSCQVQCTVKVTWLPSTGINMEQHRTLRASRAGPHFWRVFSQNLKVCSLYNSYFLYDINVFCASFPFWHHMTHLFHTMWHQPRSFCPLAPIEPIFRPVFSREKKVLCASSGLCQITQSVDIEINEDLSTIQVSIRILTIHYLNMHLKFNVAQIHKY